MREAVEGGPFPGDSPVILYTSKWRSYGLVMGGNPDNQYILIFCPFCGKNSRRNYLLNMTLQLGTIPANHWIQFPKSSKPTSGGKREGYEMFFYWRKT
jgi:hypothetical protein